MDNINLHESYNNDSLDDKKCCLPADSFNDESNSQSSTNPPGPSYYTENYRNTKPKKNNSLMQLIIVSVLSSILGGGVVFLAFQFVAPVLKPSLGNYLGWTDVVKNGTDQNALAQDNGYKKVVIEQSDSPVAAIAEKVGPSIVGIRVTAKVSDFFFGVREGRGEGSGIIIRSNGYIITNNHVIEAAMADRSNKLAQGSKIEVILPNQKNKPYLAQVIGRDAKTDLAVLKIDADNLPTVELGDSDSLKVGELAVAIGNPAGLEFMGSVTAGVISGLNRRIITEDGNEFTLIQTDAAINSGNSGGALVNSKGQVIGINTIKIGAQGYEGLGFAIPINEANEITENLIEFKYVKGRPFFGVSIDQRFNEEIAKQNNVPAGLLVADIIPLSGAYKAGIERNDIITKFDGKEVKTFKEFEDLKNKHKPDDVVKVEIFREGQTKTLDITLGEDRGN